MNETERNQLRSYIIQLRRISAHREQGVEAEIRREYQKVLNKLQAIVSKYYAIYGNIDDSTMTRADLESASAYNNFLQDVVNNLDGINKPVENQIRQTIEDTYTTCYNGMVNAVKKSTGNSDLGILLSGLSATTPETVKNIIENPMDNLTLSTVLNRKRSQVVSDIKKNLSVGLANGDSYAKMAQRISKSLDSDYKKAMRIVRTESNRAINKGFQDVSDEASDMLLGSDYVEVKEWCSMEDESVRNTHNHLNGKKIHVQDEFESKGRKAKCPCGFGVPEEDINCRCFLAYEFMSREEFLKQGGVIPDEILAKEKELLKDNLTSEYENDIINNVDDILSKKLAAGFEQILKRRGSNIEKVSFDGLDRYVARDLALKIDDLDRRYKSSAIEIKTCVPVEEERKSRGSCEYLNGFDCIKNKSINNLKSSIEISKIYNSSYEVVISDIRNLSFKGVGVDNKFPLFKTNFSVKVDKKNESVTTLVHEFGHSLIPGRISKYIVENGGACQAYSEIEQIYNSYMKRLNYISKRVTEIQNSMNNGRVFDYVEAEELNSLKKEFDDIYVSQYGNESVGEFIAECFCECELSSNPTSTSKAVYSIINKYCLR